MHRALLPGRPVLMPDLQNEIIEGARVSGTFDARFEPVLSRLAANLGESGEIGQAVCVTLAGKTVVDLWGGYKDAEKVAPWTEDTIVNMMSTGKAVGAVCVLVLADRGLLSLDEPVANYWPEFGQAGKGAVTIRHVLSHMAGIPYPDEAPDDSMYDWQAITAALEKQVPEWSPGTTPGYHSFTIGFLAGEIVRRVAGRRIAEFWREEIAGPHGLDYQIALNDEELARCVDINIDSDDPFFQLLENATNPIGRSWRPMPKDKAFNSWEFRTCGVPNFGHGNARALADFYAKLLSDGAILSRATREDATAEVWHREDAVIGIPLRHGTGFILACDAFPMSGPAAFGGAGQGGALGFADPDKGLSFAFATNHVYREDLVGIDERPVNRLIAATLACL